MIAFRSLGRMEGWKARAGLFMWRFSNREVESAVLLEAGWLGRRVTTHDYNCTIVVATVWDEYSIETILLAVLVR